MDIYNLGAGQKGLYLYLGRPTIPKLRNSILSVYCPPFRIRCKNLWPGILGDESLWYVCYIYNNLPANQGSPQKPQCTMWLHTYMDNQKNSIYS
jgi:hypothetical protein